MNCLDGVCKGLDNGEPCFSSADCGPKNFCEKQTNWPWYYLCKTLRTSYEQCTGDSDCPPANFCWYASEEDKANSLTKCLPLYSQEPSTPFGWSSLNKEAKFEDFVKNGKYCKTGIAFQDEKNPNRAMCSKTIRIDYLKKEI